jgi:hypothetical protein
MTRFSRIKLLLLSALCFVLFTGTAFAQANSGDLTGTVFDSSGSAIPNANVVATNEETGVKTTAQTNAGGAYRFTNLPAGRYTLTASATGFTTDTLKGVDVTLNNTVTANLTLAVGTVGTTVEVSASAATIDTTTAQLQTTFDTRQVFELPQTGNNSGSGVYNLALLGAGVSTRAASAKVLVRRSPANGRTTIHSSWTGKATTIITIRLRWSTFPRTPSPNSPCCRTNSRRSLAADRAASLRHSSRVAPTRFTGPSTNTCRTATSTQ